MNQYSKYLKGSEWRKWDLHIHTPLSIIQDYGGNNPAIWEKYITALENIDVNTKVIGINDYYFVDGYEKVMEFKKKGRLKNLEKIFPVIEYRIDTFASATENKFSKINLHVIFDVNENKLQDDISKIKSEFIGNIHLSRSHKTEILSIENLKAKSSDGKLKTGFSEIIPNTEEILNLAKSKQWKDKTLLVLGYAEWNDLDKSTQLKKSKTELYEATDAFFTASKTDDVTKKEEVLGFIAKDKPFKPLIHSLDIHNFSLLDPKNYNCFTWIKADPTFNGLKQIIFEPRERIYIQNEQPEEKNSYSIIDAVRFIDNRSEKEFGDDWIYLNSNLNAIIGGKSSGKSLLLYHIAKSIDPDWIKAANESKQKQQIQGYPFEADSKWDFEVKWKDGVISRLKDRSKPHKPITYVPQLYLNWIAEEGKDVLNSLVDNMLIESYEDYKLIRERKKNSINELNLNIIKEIEEFYKIKGKIQEKEKELRSLSEEKSVRKSIELIDEKIKALNKASKFTDSEMKKYDKLNDSKTSSEAAIIKKEEFIEILKIAKNQILNFSEDLSEQLSDSVLNQIEDESILLTAENKKVILSLLKSISSKAKGAMMEELESQFSKYSSASDELSELKKSLLKTIASLKPLEKKVGSEKAFDKLQKDRLQEDKKLKKIIQTKDDIGKLKEKLKIERITSLYKKLFNLYSEIVKENERYKRIKDADRLELQCNIAFNQDKFEKNFLSRINKKKSLEYLFGKKIQENEYTFDSSKHINIFEDVLKNLIEGKVILNSGFDEKGAVMSLLSDYFSTDYILIQDGDDLLKMSPGKRGIILFQLFLHLSKSTDPILLDQPEDNLDNRTVYNELNEFIKTKKIQRQIIMVSHNPNLVVSTDAENIIVANQAGQNKSGSNRQYKFEYVNGSIEHSFINSSNTGILFQSGIRQHVCEILEGGEEAFAKRESKYSVL